MSKEGLDVALSVLGWAQGGDQSQGGFDGLGELFQPPGLHDPV